MGKKEIPMEEYVEVDWFKLVGGLGGLIIGILITWYFLTH